MWPRKFIWSSISICSNFQYVWQYLRQDLYNNIYYIILIYLYNKYLWKGLVQFDRENFILVYFSDDLENLLKIDQLKFKWQQRKSNPQPLSSQTASLAKWLSVRLRTKWFWVRNPLLPFKLQILRLFQSRSSLTFTSTIDRRFTLKLVRDIILTYDQWSTKYWQFNQYVFR